MGDNCDDEDDTPPLKRAAALRHTAPRGVPIDADVTPVFDLLERPLGEHDREVIRRNVRSSDDPATYADVVKLARELTGERRVRRSSEQSDPGFAGRIAELEQHVTSHRRLLRWVAGAAVASVVAVGTSIYARGFTEGGDKVRLEHVEKAVDELRNHQGPHPMTRSHPIRSVVLLVLGAGLLVALLHSLYFVGVAYAEPAPSPGPSPGPALVNAGDAHALAAAVAAPDPVATVTTGYDTGLAVWTQDGPLWAGLIMLMLMLRTFVDRRHWIHQGRLLTGLTELGAIIAAVLQWHFSGAPASGMITAVVGAIALLHSPSITAKNGHKIGMLRDLTGLTGTWHGGLPSELSCADVAFAGGVGKM